MLYKYYTIGMKHYSDNSVQGLPVSRVNTVVLSVKYVS